MLRDLVLVGLPLALFVALLVAFVMVYRRAVGLAADTRASDVVRRSAGEHAARAAAALQEVAVRVDEVRRESAEPGGPVAAVTTAAAAATASEEARPVVEVARGAVAALRPWTGQESALAALVDALASADAALDLARGACAALPSGLASGLDASEARTGVKRGYIAVLHAREAILDAAQELAAARTAVAAPRRSIRPRLR